MLPMKKRKGTPQPSTRNSPDELATLFAKFLQWPAQFQAIRRRHYSPEITFWTFLAQVFCTGASCQEAVTRGVARGAGCGQTPSVNTAAYCKARKRLPQQALDELLQDLNKKTAAMTPDTQLWCGRKVKSVDGSSVSMPDTPQNQARYPQHSTQKPGCGFPIMRLCALFCLHSGAVLACAKSALRVSERALFRELWEHLEKDDIVLGDRGFCGYADFHLLGQRGIDCVMRRHGRRGKSSKVEKKLGDKDLLMRWKKNTVPPNWLSAEQWQALPQTLLVREISLEIATPGFRSAHIVIATTLLDPVKYPKEAIAALYRRRWEAELTLRDLKTSMKMEVLRCKSPEMVHKELSMHLIAHNLLRMLLLDASNHEKTAAQLSFKACLATVRQWAPLFATLHNRPRKHSTLYRAVLTTLAAQRVPSRPDRVEPRAVKRRPKNYQLMNKPRKEMVEIQHRNRYKKTLS